MSTTRRQSLGFILVGSIAVASVFAALITASLLWLTHSLDTTSQRFANTVEGLRAMTDASAAIAARDTATTPADRVDAEARLYGALKDARSVPMTARKERAFEEVEQKVFAYLAEAPRAGEPRAQPSLQAARAAMRGFVLADVLEARAAQAEAARRDAWSKGLALLAAMIFLIAGIAGFVVLRQSVFGPLLEVAKAIERYGRGDRTQRAPLKGAHEIARVARGFNDTADALRARDEDRVEFLAGVAHDLRNPIVAMALHVDTIRDDRPLPPEDRIRRMVDVTRRQMARLKVLVDDLLQASTMEARGVELAVESCDLQELVIETAELHRHASSLHDIVVLSPREPVVAPCDPSRVCQMLNNLIGNAIKYSPAGGQVTIEVADGPADVRIIVTDVGIGIEPADLALVFEAFRRTDASRRGFEGAGLGLAAVKRIAEAHGGHVDVSSTVGQGSTFMVSIPKTRRTKAA